VSEHDKPDDPDGVELSDEIAERWDPERLLRLVSKRAGKGSKLDLTTQARYEKRLGADLSKVRIYTGEFAEEVTRAHNAEAVTIASTGMILMGGSPEMSPVTGAGEGLLAHELTHVAQAQPGMHRKASSVGDMTFTEEHEREAEQVQSDVASGHGEPASAHDVGQKAAEQRKQVSGAVRKRVIEMLGEGEWVDELRNGRNPYRP